MTVYLGSRKTVPGYPELFVYQPLSNCKKKDKTLPKKQVKNKKEVVKQVVTQDRNYFYFENCDVTATVAHANHTADHLINRSVLVIFKNQHNPICL
jgi:aspartate/tyrosine/aromatic aminotransferase